jgi:hypothetical protein
VPRPFSALAFSSSSARVWWVCRPVSLRRAVRLVLAARACRGGPLRLSPSSLSVGVGGSCSLSLSFPWARAWERASSRVRDFWMGRVVLPVADFVAPSWAARRWPD